MEYCGDVNARATHRLWRSGQSISAIVRHLFGLLPRRLSLRRRVVEKFVAHVRPELFCHIEERIQSYLLTPLVRRISKRSIRGRIVEVRNACGNGVSRQFGCVEVISSVVASSNYFPADRITGSLPKPARALDEVTRILM